MSVIRITIGNQTLRLLQTMLCKAKSRGDLRIAKRIMAILALGGGHRQDSVCSVLRTSKESIRLWFNSFMLKGIDSLLSRKPPGRPSKLTKSQKKELDEIITEGPVVAGYPGACWRTPMVQDLIYRKFGIFYSVHYLSQLLKNMGFSYRVLPVSLCDVWTGIG